MNKPKPCPFCGEELVWEEHDCKSLLFCRDPEILEAPAGHVLCVWL